MNESFARLVAVAIGGAGGAVTRYGVGVLLARIGDGRFGHATLVVNVVGCFALGVLMHEVWAAPGKAASVWHTGVTVGLLGGLTTFSTFGYQTIRHVDAGEPLLALANVALNVVLGLAAAAVGLGIARTVWPAG